jgi:hypothetical protein
MPIACIQCWDIPDEGQWTCPKHVQYFIKQMWEIAHLVGFHYKNISRCTVRWMSKKESNSLNVETFFLSRTPLGQFAFEQTLEHIPAMRLSFHFSSIFQMLSFGRRIRDECNRDGSIVHISHVCVQLLNMCGRSMTQATSSRHPTA